MWLFYAIAGVTWLFSMSVKKKLQSSYRKWGSIRNAADATGAQTAQAVLNANAMRQVQILPGQGELSDHYDPRAKTIRLSPTVYGVPSVAAMAIAAHESGHAIQDHVGYKPFRIRTSLVPLATMGSRFGLPAAVLGMMMGSPLFIQIGVLTYLGALVFQFATLPVEFNASKRAMQQLDDLQLVDAEDRDGAKQVLRAAAMTYVAGVASAAGFLIYLVIVGGRWLFRRPPVVPPAP